MNQGPEQQKSAPVRQSPWLRFILPVGSVFGTLAGMAAIYLGYDLLKDRISPCGTIFRESSLGFETEIRFLKAEGQLRIGREALVELDERAQMTALNLKTCCTILDAGRIDPEQFLQCKASARTYDQRLKGVVALVKQDLSATRAPASGSQDSLQPSPAGAAIDPTPAIKEKIESAVAVSRAFNQRVDEIREEQSLKTLEAAPQQHVQIGAQEREPNDDNLNTNIIALDQWVAASIGGPKDSDHFAFTTPDIHRDVIRVEIKNSSTSLEPKLELFGSDKSSLGAIQNTTRGADLAHTFVADPATGYSVKVSNYYGESKGTYLIRVLATKAFDAFEPNDDITSFKPIEMGSEVQAAIMDKNDRDFFSLAMPEDTGMLRIALSNRSATLHPNVTVYDANKTQIANQQNTTLGGDLTYDVDPKSSPVYIRVSDYYADGFGAYALKVTKP